jgi:maleate isomerase
MEEELHSFVTLHSTRIPLQTVNQSGLTHMNTALRKAIDLILDCGPDVLAYGCTSGSFMEDVTHFFTEIPIPWIITSQSLILALKTVGAQRISIFTPYIDEINQKEKTFLESQGFTVEAIEGMGIKDNREIGNLNSEEIYSQAASLPDADALFLSCTNMRTFDSIQPLEATRGVTVISSNSATLWNALRVMGEGPVSHLGRLLEEWL